MKKNAILAPLGVLFGAVVFAGIGYGLTTSGMESLDTWATETGRYLDESFTSSRAVEPGNAPVVQSASSSTPTTTETPVETETAASQARDERPQTYTTEEGYTGTVVPDHENYTGETWISRTDSNGVHYYRASVFIAAYNDVFDIVDYESGCYFVGQDGQPIYYDEGTGKWTLVDYYTPWVSPF